MQAMLTTIPPAARNPLELTDEEWEGVPTTPNTAPDLHTEPDLYSPATLGLEVELRERIPYSFAVDSLRKVDIVLGAIADAEARADRIRRHAALMIRRAEQEAEYLRHHYMAGMEETVRRALSNTRQGCLTLTNGSVGFSRERATITVEDCPDAVEWALNHLPDAVTVTLDTEAVAASLKKSKEPLPAFATRESSHRRFSINPGGPA